MNPLQPDLSNEEVELRAARARVEVYRTQQKLIQPYRLPFGTIGVFDSFYVSVKSDHRWGIGEVTPLPGYSDETPESVTAAAISALTDLEQGQPLSEVVSHADAHSPFLASGIVCAVETWRDANFENFDSPPQAVRLAALCDAENPDAFTDLSSALYEEGYRALKMKVGARSVAEDAAAVKAVAAALPADCELRLDANQMLSFVDARRLCDELDGVPVTLLEQPFSVDSWDDHKSLASEISIPIMLDESICTLDDLDKAVAVGASYVKLKLCKHPGMAATLTLLRSATERGLGVVFGNGVQSEIGNYLEALVYNRAKLVLAAELNGFQKIQSPLFDYDAGLDNGRVEFRRMAPRPEPLRDFPCFVTADLKGP